jgi:hypothetical protein
MDDDTIRFLLRHMLRKYVTEDSCKVGYGRYATYRQERMLFI